MDQSTVVKQMLDFNKTSFNNTYEAIVLIQDQAEKITDSMLEQATWIPKDSKVMINEWVAACKKGRDDFKKSIDDSFDKLENMFKSA